MMLLETKGHKIVLNDSERDRIQDNDLQYIVDLYPELEELLSELQFRRNQHNKVEDCLIKVDDTIKAVLEVRDAIESLRKSLESYV